MEEEQIQYSQSAGKFRINPTPVMGVDGEEGTFIQEVSNNIVYAKLAQAQSMCSAISKKGKGHNYNYAKIEDIIDMLSPILATVKASVLSNVESVGDKDWLVTSFVCSDTAKAIQVKTRLFYKGAVNRGNDMQQMGSALTYARRYNHINLFNLIAEDDDAKSLTKKAPPKNHAPKKTIVDGPLDKLRKLISNDFVSVEAVQSRCTLLFGQDNPSRLSVQDQQALLDEVTKM